MTWLTRIARNRAIDRLRARRVRVMAAAAAIRGSVVIDGRVQRAGDFHHADEDSDHGEITTTEGAEVLLMGAIEDYLPSAQPPPGA